MNSRSPGVIQGQWLELVDYEKSLDLQQEYWQKALDSRSNFILGLMHPLVITLGKRAQREVDVLNSDPALHVVQIDRGGQATLHNPGQLVIYPIIQLEQFGFGVKDYVERVMDVTAQVLSELGVHTERGQESGLYTSQGKIAFVGIRVDHGITRHGVSINVENDLEPFSWIRSCGHTQARIDSLKGQGVRIKPKDLFEKWVEKWIQSC